MSLLKVNTIRNRNGTGSPAFDFGVNISGISTVSGVKISSGIITSFSQSGIVTYYGDGQGLNNIPNASLQNSTISGKSLGTNLSNLTAGSYLTSGGTYNGSTARTFAVDATNANTANKVVARDSNGDFSSRYITATQFIRSGGTSSQFLKADGSVDSNSYITSSSIGNGTLSFSAGVGVTFSLSPSFTANQSGNKDITVSTNAVSSNTVNTLVLRNSSGGFSAGPISATNVTSVGVVTASSFVVSGVSSVGFLRSNGSIDTSTYLTTAGIGDGTLILSANGLGLSISNSPQFTANQSSNKTITITSNATSLNATNTIVFRDINGNFAAGVITATNLNCTNITATTVTATNVNSTSDASLKTDVIKIENALEKIEEIDGVEFKWKNNHQKSMGVIAQDIEKILPDLVYEMDSKKSVNYNGLIALLIESVKELKKEIDELKNK
jgi:hypothetical protein